VEFEDYYKTLGVARDATPKEIKDAYRKLARKHHPDMNKGDARAEARFKLVNEANEVLSDPEKRRRYDELGAHWKENQAAGAAAGSGPFTWHSARPGAAGFGGEGFSDFFRTFFAGGGGGGGFGAPDLEDLLGARAGGVKEQTVELTLEEVAHGTTRSVTGGGRQKKLEVRIPPGVRDGARVRVAGHGAAARAGRRGDLFLSVKVLPHERFQRRGDDLLTRVVIPLTAAVLGGEIEVPTLSTPISIRVPPGTASGQTLRARGKGLPTMDAGGGRGDLLVAIDVALPKTLGRRERELFEELRDLGH